MILKDRMRRSSPIWRRIIKRSEDAQVNKGIIGFQAITGGTAGNHTVSRIKKNDHLVAVTEITTSSAAVVDRTAEFTIASDGVINNTGGTDTSSDGLLVIWEAFDDE
jgi:hypothetical protein